MNPTGNRLRLRSFRFSSVPLCSRRRTGRRPDEVKRPEMRKALAGHGWWRTSTNRGYGAKDMVRRFTAKTLVAAVERVAYPGLDLSHLRPGKCSAGHGT